MMTDQDKISTVQKLWQTFSAHPQICDRSPGVRIHSTYKSLTRLLCKFSPVGVVHAAEEELTTIQRLGQEKPVLLLQQDEVHRYISQETGKDRLKELFTKRDEQFHPDLQLVMGVSQNSAVITFVVTSIFGAQAAREKFIQKKKHTKFATKFLAARAHNDVLIIGAIKFGGRWALKVFFFTSLFLTTAQCIATYRNKTSVMEYTIATGLTSSLLRANLGWRGMVAGGIIGAVLGTAGGVAFYLTMKATGETQEIRHYWHVHNRLQDIREAALLSGKGSSVSDTLLDNTMKQAPS